jgi:3'(2'), 5'-bisphosphate nucleotidase
MILSTGTVSERLSLLRLALELANRAGQRILELYEVDPSAQLKSDRSPLTLADLASHHLIVEGLERATPGVPVLSEESRLAEVQEREKWERYWLVDPLDGTKEFIKRTGEFTVNISMIERGVPTIGVVHVPVFDRTYHAVAGGGSYRRMAGGQPQRIRTRVPDTERLTVVASRDHAGPAVLRLLDRLPPGSSLSVGSSLKFCMVAEGRADLYPRDVPTMEWDTAAAQCVVEEAGGKVLDFAGEMLRYNKPDLRNPSILTVGDPGLDWRSWLG